MKSSFLHTCLLSISLAFLLILSGYTLIHAVTGFSVLVGAIALLILFYFLRKAILSASPVFEKNLFRVLWILIPLLQAAFILLMHNNIRYDAYWVYTQAVEMLDTHQISPTLHDGYFTQVPNNYGHTLLTYWFLSLVKFLGCPRSGYMTAVQFFNTAFIDLSLLCIYGSICKLKSKKSALFFLLFCALTPFPYVWTLYYYTSTTSMFFACAAIYLWLCIRDLSAKDNAARYSSCLLAALLGFLCITGFKVRATSLIAYLAILLFWIVSPRKGSFKKALPALAVFVVSTALSFIAWKAIVAHYAPFDTTDTAFPVTHFIMLGSRFDGSFIETDRLYTASLPTAQAKLEGTISVIKERLSAAGPAGILKLLSLKQLYVWKDGTDLACYEFSLSTDFNLLHSLIMGSKNHYFIAFSQMLRVVELFLVCVSCIAAFLRKKADGIFLLTLNLLGGMVFHLLWETSPAYSIPFTFFFFALACDGLEHLSEVPFLKKEVGSKAVLATSGGVFLVTCALLLFQFRTTCGEVILADDYVAHQPMFDHESDPLSLEEGKTWRQSFVSDKPFNVWQLFTIPSHVVDNTSIYQITLSDEHGTIFYDEPFYAYNSGYNGYLEFGTNLAVPDGATTYYMDIRVINQDEENYITFLSLDESLEDMYPYGSLTIDGDTTDHDLSFRIMHRHQTPLATKKEYCAMAALLILLELFLIFRSLRLIKSSRLVH